MNRRKTDRNRPRRKGPDPVYASCTGCRRTVDVQTLPAEHRACHLEGPVIDEPARAVWYSQFGLSTLDNWESLRPELKEHWRRLARAAISAYINEEERLKREASDA